MYKVLWISDGGCSTGFARVAHSVIDNLGPEYEIHHIAVNYFGDPYSTKNLNHKMYPAQLGGDIYGIGRTSALVNKLQPDLVFILNDLWIIKEFVARMDTPLRNRTVVYFPVDAMTSSIKWLKDFEELGAIVAYTEFGKQEVLSLKPYLHVDIIPHGIDPEVFYPVNKLDARKQLGTIKPDDFVVLNAQRNQPRKRIDLTLKGFAEFAKDKPDNVRLYCHMGLVDEGWPLDDLAIRYNIDNRLIITSTKQGPQSGVTDSKLNLIYNACDVGINTSLGEGWGLPSVEQACTKTPQIVPDSSACKELFQNRGLLLPIENTYVNHKTLTTFSVVSVDGIVEALNALYYDSDYRNLLGNEAYNYFTQDKFLWKNIAKQWDNTFKQVLAKVASKNANNVAE